MINPLISCRTTMYHSPDPGHVKHGSMHAWLRAAAERLSAATGAGRAELELSPGEVDALLALAGTAAHESGARTNAPLTCYLVGVTRGLTGAPLDELVASVAAGAPGELSGDREQEDAEEPS